MIRCTDAELASKRRFEEVYRRSKTPVMLAIEREVCGCDYGANSWTTREQADELARSLGIDAGTRLVDLGAGSGWPALYMAKKTGCSITLVDLPEVGLQLAKRRSQEDGFSDRVAALVADAAELPLPDGSFDAVSHSDLLCCLVRKDAVLGECRRIVRPDGCMALTVISIVFGLSRPELERARANAPEFAEVDCDYAVLLRRAGWAVEDRIDLTATFSDSCVRQFNADVDRRDALAALLGGKEAQQRIDGWQNKLQAIRDGLAIRELMICRPS